MPVNLSPHAIADDSLEIGDLGKVINTSRGGIGNDGMGKRMLAFRFDRSRHGQCLVCDIACDDAWAHPW